jgi:ABC-2 type transport system ATP-binding protein
MSVIVNQLTKKYDDQLAVNDISFKAKTGSILGFLGPNGAGKTTTMKMLCCYTPPTSGNATVGGYDILTHPLEVRRQIGYLPEHNPLYEEMYIKEYLQFVASIHRIADREKRIAEIIEITGLGREQNKIIGTLSKGYRQRVGLAQAIIHDPKVLILDEPTSGLDMNQLQDIRSLITELGKSKTVIFSSHIMQEVEALCQEVVIIDQGKLVAFEDIESLRGKMKGSQVIILELLDKNVDTSILKSIKGVTSITNKDNKLHITTDASIDVRSDVFKVVVSHGWTLLEMHRERANVEEVFRQLTKKSEYV